MDAIRVPIPVFSNFATSGSVYNSQVYDLTDARNVRFYIEGAKAGGATTSWTVWFYHRATKNGEKMHYTRVIRLGDTGGTITNLGHIDKLNISSDAGGTCVAGYLDPNFIPFNFQVEYEMSAVTASASTGTMSMWLLWDPVKGINW